MLFKIIQNSTTWRYTLMFAAWMTFKSTWIMCFSWYNDDMMKGEVSGVGADEDTWFINLQLTNIFGVWSFWKRNKMVNCPPHNWIYYLSFLTITRGELRNLVHKDDVLVAQGRSFVAKKRLSRSSTNCGRDAAGRSNMLNMRMRYANPSLRQRMPRTSVSWYLRRVCWGVWTIYGHLCLSWGRNCSSCTHK